MPPVSSFIFVVILAVWAVYLVQHWVRRRDHLATARSVDRFSEAMRVLDRRRTLPRPDLTEATPRSYAVSPLRPAAPQVVVKRGTVTASTTTSTGATEVRPTPALRRSRSAAQRRAGALAVATVAMAALVVLGAAGVWPWWTILLGPVLLLATLAGIRSSVERERRQRIAARRGGGATAAPRAGAPSAGRSSTAISTPVRAGARPGAPRSRSTGAHPVRTQAAEPAGPAERPAPQRRVGHRSDLYDIDQVEASLSPQLDGPLTTTDPTREVTVTSAGPAVEVERGTWTPAPVPTPTYILKARAHRTGAPVLAGQGASGLPADGADMALAEEDEELPRVHVVG